MTRCVDAHKILTSCPVPVGMSTRTKLKDTHRGFSRGQMKAEVSEEHRGSNQSPIEGVQNNEGAKRVEERVECAGRSTENPKEEARPNKPSPSLLQALQHEL